MKYLLDTNILRYYTKSHPTLMENLARVVQPPVDEIVVPFIVYAEQMRGRYDALLKAEPQNLLREQIRLKETQALLDSFGILYLNEHSAEKLLELRQKHSTKKRYVDVIVAAMALGGRHIVVTRNVDDFRDLLPAEQIQNWIDQVY